MAELTLESAQISLRRLYDLQPDLTSLESVEKLLKELPPKERQLKLENHPDKAGPESTERFQQILAEMQTLAAFLKKHLEKLKSDRTLAVIRQKVREDKQQKDEEAKRKQAEEEAARLMEERAEKKRRRQEVLKLVVGGVSFAMCVHSEYIASEDLAKACSFDRWLYMTKKGKLDKSNADLGLANERASSLESQLEQQTLEAKQTAEKLGTLENEIISIVKGLAKKSESNFILQLFQSGKCGSNQSIKNVREAFRVMHQDQAKAQADLSKQCLDLQTGLQDMERKTKEWESQYNDLYGRNQELEESKLALEGERGNLQTDCETARKKLNKVLEDWVRREEAHAKESQDLQSQNKSMVAELQDLRSRKQSMDEELHQQKEEIARQKLELLERDKEVQNFSELERDCAMRIKEVQQRAENLEKELAEAVQGKTEATQREETLRCEHDELKKELAVVNERQQMLNRKHEELKLERADLEKACHKLETQGPVSRIESAKSSNDSNDSDGSADRMAGTGVVRGNTDCDGASGSLPVDPTKASSSQALFEEVGCAVKDWLQERTGVDERLQLMVLMLKLQNGVMKWSRATSQGQASQKSLESCIDSKLGSEAANSKS